MSEQPMHSAPKDGRWIEVHSTQSDDWFKMQWNPDGNSWNDDCTDLVVTGVWTDGDGWLQPNEVDAWRECG